MSDVLVIGRNLLLGAQIVGKLLGGTDHYVTWLIENLDSHIAEELNALIFKKIESHKPSGLKGSLRSRLALLEWEPDVEGNIRADEMWLLEGKDAWPALTAKEKEESALVRSLRILESSGARMLSYVASIYDCDCVVPGILPELSIREQRIAAFCKARDIAAHFFLTSWLIGEDYVSSDSGEEVHCLLHALDEVIAEIQERTPEYFDFKPLRVVAARDAAVNLLHMASAVDFMLGASAKHAGADLRQIVVSAQDTPWQDFCEQLGEAYGVSMLSVEAPDELNAIDRLLGQRLSELQSAWSGENVVCFHSSELPNGLIVDREMQIEFLNAVRRKQEQERTARDERVSALPDKWRKKVVPVNAGELTYYLAGTEGEYVLILNALGQPLDYWHRLVDVLMRRNRVIIWETRGLSESEALRLDDHLSDIDAVLREERIDSCHLVGWCTGPQVAVEFYVRRPAAVLDMIFLSCAFKVAGHPELETAYGWNLEGLCRAMIDNPAMTASIRRSLSKPASSDINLDDKDAKQLSAQVLLLTNKNLRTCVLAPFQTETSTFNYARQILLLAATPTLEYAKRVQVPVLVIGCECDQVAAAAKSSAVARLFTTSRHVELPGATHYSFYDRPKLVAGMMQSFFREGRVAATLETLAVGAGQ